MTREAATLGRAVLAAWSLREYVEQAWPLLEPSRPFVPGRHIDVICAHLEAVTRGEIRDLLITVPPRHTKSTVVSQLWPTWCWAWDPGKRFLTASYKETLAERDAMLSRVVLASRWYRDRFMAGWRLSSDQNTKGPLRQHRARLPYRHLGRRRGDGRGRGRRDHR
jgi:hypothetical protein